MPKKEFDVEVLIEQIEKLHKRRMNLKSGLTLEQINAIQKRKFPNLPLDEVVLIAGSYCVHHAYGMGYEDAWYYMTTKSDLKQEKKIQRKIDAYHDKYYGEDQCH